MAKAKYRHPEVRAERASKGAGPGVVVCWKSLAGNKVANQGLKYYENLTAETGGTQPVRKPNAAYRSREHLTEREIERLVEAAKDNRWGLRDSTMVLLALRHGLRAADGASPQREDKLGVICVVHLS